MNKFKDAKGMLEILIKMNLKIFEDHNNFFANAFKELMKYLNSAESGVAKSDDVVAVLNYMKTVRKDGIRV